MGLTTIIESFGDKHYCRTLRMILCVFVVEGNLMGDFCRNLRGLEALWSAFSYLLKRS